MAIFLLRQDWGPIIDGDLSASDASLVYAAFISYSHADQKIAQWLQQSIERYRVPKRLIGRQTANGPIPPRLGKCFRDRDELPASADLKAEIISAIDQCRFLIVICSPTAARSMWVNQEITSFKLRRSADKIIAVIAGGEPGSAGNECFPLALRYQFDESGKLTDTPAEPIAADLRPGKDPKRAAILKILAGMLGIGLDELVRREAQRRQRLYGWITAGAAMTSLSFAGLAIEAWRQRDIAVKATAMAQEKRTQAEGLIEFMIEDLHGKLMSVGRLDVLDSVSERAMTYFATLSPEEMTGASSGQKARVLVMLATNQSQRGEQSKARETFLEAWRAAKAAVAESPDNPDRLFEYAEACNGLGYGYYGESDFANAHLYFDEAVMSLEKILSKKPKDPTKYTIEIQHALLNTGVIELNSMHFEQAIYYFEKNVESAKLDLVSHPDSVDNIYNYGQSLAWKADAMRLTGKTSQAIDLRNEELRTYREGLTNNPEDKTLLRSVIYAERAIATLKSDSGKYGDALKELLHIQEKMEAQYKFDPNNTSLLSSLISIKFDTAYNQMEIRKFNDAKKLIEDADSLFDVLTKKADSNSKISTDLINKKIFINCYYLYFTNNLKEFDDLSSPVVSELYKTAPEKKNSAASLYNLTSRLTVAAFAARRFESRGDRVSATKLAEVIVKKIEEFAEPRSVTLEALRAPMLALLGNTDESRRSLERVCRSDYRRFIGVEACHH